MDPLIVLSTWRCSATRKVISGQSSPHPGCSYRGTPGNTKPRSLPLWGPTRSLRRTPNSSGGTVVRWIPRWFEVLRGAPLDMEARSFLACLSLIPIAPHLIPFQSPPGRLVSCRSSRYTTVAIVYQVRVHNDMCASVLKSVIN